MKNNYSSTFNSNTSTIYHLGNTGNIRINGVSIDQNTYKAIKDTDMSLIDMMKQLQVFRFQSIMHSNTLGIFNYKTSKLYTKFLTNSFYTIFDFY